MWKSWWIEQSHSPELTEQNTLFGVQEVINTLDDFHEIRVITDASGDNLASDVDEVYLRMAAWKGLFSCSSWNVRTGHVLEGWRKEYTLTNILFFDSQCAPQVTSLHINVDI